MTQDEKRAQIIADQAAREAANPTTPPKHKPRSNWAASPPVAPSRRFSMRRTPGDAKK